MSRLTVSLGSRRPPRRISASAIHLGTISSTQMVRIVNGHFKVTGFGQLKVSTSGCSGLPEPTTSFLVGTGQRTASSACLPHPERLALGDDHDGVVEEAV